MPSYLAPGGARFSLCQKVARFRCDLRLQVGLSFTDGTWLNDTARSHRAQNRLQAHANGIDFSWLCGSC
eukprot:2003887-Pyramimonas_sp.AAC.1